MKPENAPNPQTTSQPISLPKRAPRISTVDGSVIRRNRHRGDRHERDLVQRTGLDPVPGSGCGSFFRGDLGTPFGWFVEAKTRVGLDLRFQPNWWTKAVQDASALGRPHIALIYQFTDASKSPQFLNGPSELLICLESPALRALIDQPTRWIACHGQVVTIPYLEHLKHLDYRSGALGITMTTTLRGMPRIDHLWVVDSRVFPRLIKDTP